ncbi:hypothetical protein IKA15_04735 [bacterium]|nr:hypothetical protein [bacterium]
MLNLLLHREKPCKLLENIDLNYTMSRLKQIYGSRNIAEERQFYISEVISRYGYIPHPHYEVLENFNVQEIIYALEQKLIYEKVYDGEKFIKFKNPSPLARRGIKNSEWFKREGHDIKLMSLAALNDGNKKETGKFIQWVAQLLTLPNGSVENNILPATIYLIPFHPREFGCAYLPMSSSVSENIKDEKLEDVLGLNADAQVKLFIALAQLAGHPVIYDILPQTARFSKIILSNPSLARWYDINRLTDQIKGFTDSLVRAINSKKGRKPYTKEDVFAARDVYFQILEGSKKRISKQNQEIIKLFEDDLKEYKIFASYKMTFKDEQEEIVSRVREVIRAVNGIEPKCEEDVKKQPEIISALIKEGLWPAPGGAWCSAGVPVFDKMNPTKEYPLFVHYDHNCNDVSEFANLDCQTPYYFTYFETKRTNWSTVDYFLNYMKNLRNNFNFDGFRVDHIDHIVDEMSQDSEGNPISYRAPRNVLRRLNSKMKADVPYFATLAEYMLWDNYYKEYHKDMKFDLLWGNDIVSQGSKTPKQIIEDNNYLAEYNKKNPSSMKLSVIKTYNNQDGEFEAINQYPGQLGEEGALFKWFKYKFLPAGEYANRPCMFVDGDESFTARGIESVIGAEISMKRNKNWSFFERFDAIDRFTANSKLLTTGVASLIEQKEDGFVAWKISSDKVDYEYLIVANYLAPTELKDVEDDGCTCKRIVKGTPTFNNTVKLEGSKIVSYFDFVHDDMLKMSLQENKIENAIEGEINFEVIQPSEFKIYKIVK